MKKKKPTLILILILANLVTLFSFLQIKSSRAEVVFFNVGQGDAALVRSSQGHNILIDGGPGEKILPHLSAELPFWDRKIDLMILTHAHADHLSGLVEVSERYDVEKILWNGQSHDSLLYKQWEALLDDIESKKAYKGQRIKFDNFHLDVLHPPKDIDYDLGLNENSVINRLIHEDGAILFMGDAYKKQEKRLLELERRCLETDYGWCKVMELPSNVLKAGHHGSSTSSDPDFIERVDPEVAIISAGIDNRYGHPHEETLETLRGLDVDMHKTFENGNLRIELE